MLDQQPFSPPAYSIAASRWHVRRYVERNMRSSVVISRMEMRPGDVDEVSWEHPAEPVVPLRVLYSGPARIHHATDSRVDTAGEQQVFTTTWVTTPVDVGGVPLVTQKDDMVEVVSSEDPLTTGRWFQVLGVESGGLFPDFRRHQVTGASRFPEWTYVEEP